MARQPKAAFVVWRADYFSRTSDTNNLMERLPAFKYKLMPNGDQQLNMRRVAGSCRYVFNEALAMEKARYERGGNLAMPDCARL
jgi:hypothetical protein